MICRGISVTDFATSKACHHSIVKQTNLAHISGLVFGVAVAAVLSDSVFITTKAGKIGLLYFKSIWSATKKFKTFSNFDHHGLLSL